VRATELAAEGVVEMMEVATINCVSSNLSNQNYFGSSRRLSTETVMRGFVITRVGARARVVGFCH
jgi:hypothetical protein|tara:strand:- start:4957 stop:5151 length:195 start_codon:yes stop_codon:yes gene_type:complete